MNVCRQMNACVNCGSYVCAGCARKFKVGDAVQTGGGLSARIVADNVNCISSSGKHYPLVVLIRHSNGRETLHQYRADGQMFDQPSSQDDLVPAPRKRTVWIPIVAWDDGPATDGSYATREAALASIGRPRVGVIRVEIEEGKFDD